MLHRSDIPQHVLFMVWNGTVDARLEKNTDTAMTLFQKIVSLSHSGGDLKDETVVLYVNEPLFSVGLTFAGLKRVVLDVSYRSVFKALRSLVSLSLQTKKLEEMNTFFQQLVSCIPRVTRTFLTLKRAFHAMYLVADGCCPS